MNRYPEVGALIGAKYRLVAPLGVGGMGAVFRARNELIDKEVALKLLNPRNEADPAARDRFVREARFAARIRHPHVVEIYDVGIEDEGSSFLVMELLEGETFASLLERRDTPVKDLLRWLCQGMRGVAVAHRMGVIHRDIKPENLFVSYGEHHPEGLTKVLDFGISKLVDDSLLQSPITNTGVALGTPAYMSMEQLCAAPDLDVRTDIYSFGVLLYRVLTGRLPFDQKSLPSLAFAIATQTPPAPRELRPDLPAALADIVSKAIAREREQRYATMNELFDALAPWLASSATLSTSLHASASADYKSQESLAPVELATQRVRAVRPLSRTALWWSAGVAAVLSALGLWLAGSKAPTAHAPSSAQPPAVATTIEPDHLPPPQAAAIPVAPAPSAAAAQAVQPQKPTSRRRAQRKLDPQPAQATAPAATQPTAAEAPASENQANDTTPSRTAAGKRSGTLRQDEL